jgi:hypothetical protein
MQRLDQNLDPDLPTNTQFGRPQLFPTFANVKIHKRFTMRQIHVLDHDLIATYLRQKSRFLGLGRPLHNRSAASKESIAY